MTVLALRLISWCLARLPLSAALWLGRASGMLLGSVLRFRRRYVLDALERSLPELSPAERYRISGRMYQQLGMTVVEVLRLSVLGLDDLRDRVTFHGEEHLKEVAGHEQGSLALMAHLGNWEAISLLPDRLGKPCAVVVKPLKKPGLQSYLAETRSRKMNMKLFYAREAYRDCLKAIRGGSDVAMILDQNTLRSRGVFVDFFGKTACTTPGLALIAARTQRPVFPMFDIRRDHRHHDLYILPPVPPPPDREKETLHAFTQQYTRIIEDMIRGYPDQWIWLHRRWRTQPAEEKPGNAGP